MNIAASLSLCTVSCALVAMLGFTATTVNAAPRKPAKRPTVKKPAVKPTPPAALVRAWAPDARLLRQGKPVKAVKKGTALRDGDIVKTGARGGVDIEVRGLGTVRAKPTTTCRFLALQKRLVNEDAASHDTRLKVDRGTLLARLAKLKGKSRFIIDTPSAVTAARGTGYLVTVAGKTTRVLVDEGAVAVTLPDATDKELLVGPQEKAVVADGTLPESAQALTAAEAKAVREVRRLAVPSVRAGGGIVWAQGPAGAEAVALQWIDSRRLELANPVGIAVAPDGTVYVSDGERSVWMLREGKAARLVGPGRPGYNPATPPLQDPWLLALGLAGELLVTDQAGGRISVVDAAGRVSTVAGGPKSAALDADRTHTRFQGITGLTVCTDGVIYVTDHGDAGLRRVRPGGVDTPAGRVTVGGYNLNGLTALDGRTLVLISHAGLAAFDVQTLQTRPITLGAGGLRDGPPGTARFFTPSAAACFGGTIYCNNGDTNVLRRVTPDGAVVTIAGSGIARSADGAGPQAELDGASALAAGPAGDIYFTEVNTGRVRVLTRSGAVKTLSGHDTTHPIILTPGYRDGPPAVARLGTYKQVSLSPNGDVYVWDLNRLRRIRADGSLETVAGRGTNGHDDGRDVEVTFNGPPMGATFLPDGTLLAGWDRIRRISPDGQVRTIYAPVGENDPVPHGFCAAPDGTCYFLSRNALYRFREGGVPELIAGELSVAQRRTPRDGRGKEARFAYPAEIVYGAGGIYVLDGVIIGETRPNQFDLAPLVRRVALDGTVRTVAGSPRRGEMNGFGGEVTFGGVFSPCVDRQGNLYVLDYQPDGTTMRMITPDGNVTTVARKVVAGHWGTTTADGVTFYLAPHGVPEIRRWRPPAEPEIIIGRPERY